MKYRKFNKFEKKEVRSQMIENALHGEGVYLYRNNSMADLTLPRPTRSGIRSVGPKQEFQGDNYYMQLVKSGMLRLVKEIQSPEQQRAALEGNMQEKLILDQPDMITENGKVEHVVSKPAQKLNETKSGKEKQVDVLLNEDPIEGGFVIVG
jgi:uncharacterized membrane protein